MRHPSISILGLGLLGPGLPTWEAGAAVLRGEAPYAPSPTALPLPQTLPPAERRRAGRVIKLALAIGAEALAQAPVDARELATVFTSSGGDGDNCHEICNALASGERLISPTRFHNSVHNAASGYWGIAYGCGAASTALCAYDASFAAGLLEASTQLEAGAGGVLLLAYDAEYPPPLSAKRPIPDAFGVALLLVPGRSGAGLAQLRLGIGHEPAARMALPSLEALRRAIPAARGLPLLERLARRAAGHLALDYLGRATVAVEVEI